MAELRMRSENRNQKRVHAGFSLIELLVVMTIMLIVLAFAIPNMATAVESYRLEVASRTISGKLTDARIWAIKQNRQSWLEFRSDVRTCQVQSADAAGVVIDIGPAESLPAGIAFDTLPTPAHIIYDPMGRIANVPNPPFFQVRLRVVRSGQSKTLTVSSAGKVTVQ